MSTALFSLAGRTALVTGSSRGLGNAIAEGFAAAGAALIAGRKDSAEGTLSVTDALRAFSIRSMVAAKQTETSEKLLDAIVMEHKSKFINTRYIF